MNRAIIYTRFSPQREAEKSVSCETQIEYCRKYADEKGLEVAAVIEDKAVSGADEYRANLWGAIDQIRRGDVLIVYKRDRLARNLYLSEQINRAVKSKGGRIAAVSGDVDGDGPEHAMIRQVLASIAEYERKLIGQRTRHAMLSQQRAGKRVGRFAPYGWKIGPPGRIIEDPEEQAFIEKIRELAPGLNECPNRITKELNKNYREKSRSGRWSVRTVRKILERIK